MEHKQYNIKMVFEPTRQSLDILNYDSMARNKEELKAEILHYLTIQTFEVDNA
jgi:hypothetical protein